MKGVIIFLIVSGIIGLIIWTIITSKRNKRNQQLYGQLKEKQEALKALQETTNQLSKAAHDASIKLDTINKSIEEKTQFNNTLLKIREDELNNLMEEKKESAIARLEREIAEWGVSAQEAASAAEQLRREALDVQFFSSLNELNEIKALLEDYKAKRDAINKEIMQAREIRENNDFYRIVLGDNEKDDISYLLSITDRFHNKEVIYKLIWSEYLQRPMKAMLNRVLGARDPKNVIYMIKNVNTEEIYIGKTRGNVSKRWTEHIKTSLNIGTISHTFIHNALFKHWDEFAFSILEEVASEDELGAREKFYIDHYQSNIYGYNIKAGG